jgi:biotin-dependent carboxylase-like uncharacterized protein
MIEVVTSGFRSSIQDLGRFGGRSFGIPVSGAMDQQAFEKGNRILGNSPNSAGIEWMMQGPILKFSQPTVICLTGGLQQPTLNEELVKQDRPIFINPGDQLKLGQLVSGVYGYVLIEGGIDSERILNSQSQFEGITKIGTIRKGDRIAYQPSNHTFAEIKTQPSNIDDNNTIKVVKGPEFHQLSDKQLNLLFNSEHELSPVISRMGYRFMANQQLSTTEIITAPVLPGIIQLTPSGELIALMRDAQTTGGYARVLKINAQGIDQLAQKRVGSLVRICLES